MAEGSCALWRKKYNSDEKYFFLPIPLRLFSIWFFSCLDNQHHFEGKKSLSLGECCIRKESIYHKRWNFDDFSGGGFENPPPLIMWGPSLYPFKRFVSLHISGFEWEEHLNKHCEVLFSKDFYFDCLKSKVYQLILKSTSFLIYIWSSRRV